MDEDEITVLYAEVNYLKLEKEWRHRRGRRPKLVTLFGALVTLGTAALPGGNSVSLLTYFP
jgi:hypothetical protein